MMENDWNESAANALFGLFDTDKVRLSEGFTQPYAPIPNMIVAKRMKTLLPALARSQHLMPIS